MLECLVGTQNALKLRTDAANQINSENQQREGWSPRYDVKPQQLYLQTFEFFNKQMVMPMWQASSLLFGLNGQMKNLRVVFRANPIDARSVAIEHGRLIPQFEPAIKSVVGPDGLSKDFTVDRGEEPIQRVREYNGFLNNLNLLPPS